MADSVFRSKSLRTSRKLTSWLDCLVRGRRRRHQRRAHAAESAAVRVEQLEDRALLTPAPFGPGTDISTTADGVRSIVAADLDGDGDTDLISASQGDDEITSAAQAIAWFGLDAVGRSPARMDFDKLDNLNSHYLRQLDRGAMLEMLQPALSERLGRDLKADERARVERGLEPPIERAKTVVDLAERAWFLVAPRPLVMDDKAAQLLTADSRELLGGLQGVLEKLEDWSHEGFEAAVRAFAEQQDLKLGKVAQPLRAALTGQAASPGIFDVAYALGREETLARMSDQSG